MHGRAEHQHNEHRTGRKIAATVFVNIFITLTEFIGGIVSGSLSLLSDALHNLSDVFAVLISYIGFRLSLVENSERRTFGLKRAEVFAALLNSVLLVFLSLFLFKEAYERFLVPASINTSIVMGVGLFGLFGNLLSMYLLDTCERKNMNIRSAFLHMVADALSSVAVVLGALLIRYSGITLVDPILTFIIGGYVLFESFKLLSSSIRILMQVAPPHLDIYKIKQAIESIPGIKNVHHIHLWSLSDVEVFFEAHVESEEDIKLSGACRKINEIERLLKEKFGISHTTIQFEYEACEDKSLIRRRGRKSV